MSVPHRPEQGHSRHASNDARRVAMPRRSTKGPLDIDTDVPPPFQPPTPALQTALPPSPAPSQTHGPPRTASPASSLLSPSQSMNPRTRSTSPASRTTQLDLTPLLRPSLYAPIPTTGIASPYLDASYQPPPDTALSTLLSQRRYRHAAARAADELTSVTAATPQKVLELLHIRLACLVLCSQPTLAAKEGKLLSDLIARDSAALPRPERDVFLTQVPWPLRLLLLRLQVLGTGELRRGIMGLYTLASECRVLHQKARAEKDEDAQRLWAKRLMDLGIRVAGQLVEMGELETARRHLETLETTPDLDGQVKREMGVRKALLLLRIGDVGAAERCIAPLSSSATSSPSETEEIQTGVLTALTHVSSASFDQALSLLGTLHAKFPSSELVTHNLAIAHLYSGDVTRASEILERLVHDDEVVFPGLLFNLATVYELRTERARERKLELVDRVVGIEGAEGRGGGGWERGVGDFKLG